MYGQQPGYPPPVPPTPPRRSSPWKWIGLGCGGTAAVMVGGVACAAVLTAGAGGGGGAPAGESEAPAAAEGESESPATGQERVPLGEAGTVGDWQVTVNGVDTAESYGDEYLREQAQGVFKIVGLDVENTGSQANYFDSSNVILLDADGNEHSSQVTLASEDVFLEQINPGNSVSGEVVFDVPADAQIETVQVEDMMSLDEPLEFETE
ncbi:DUF4352 domain-containing protein [Streptomonospora litoralis]|uniref:Telomeric repeat-binding factor 2 n=1 Tax=Streptomonospora litoralis TaxID=2498135 RepID=A0A4P6PYX2_9ACTN|nr:DUF4352 domain-containing protein [Streptomonospora litoralis]QBI53506.1 Telomeric repeat-binding factor 2 [Streptomonospora litoralis]